MEAPFGEALRPLSRKEFKQRWAVCLAQHRRDSFPLKRDCRKVGGGRSPHDNTQVTSQLPSPAAPFTPPEGLAEGFPNMHDGASAGWAIFR